MSNIERENENRRIKIESGEIEKVEEYVYIDQKTGKRN